MPEGRSSQRVVELLFLSQTPRLGGSIPSGFGSRSALTRVPGSQLQSRLGSLREPPMLLALWPQLLCAPDANEHLCEPSCARGERKQMEKGEGGGAESGRAGEQGPWKPTEAR